MHELSIALEIVDIAAQEASRYAGTTTAVHINLGPLAGVVKESLLSAWELARMNSPLEAAVLIIQDIPIVAFCPACRADRDVISVQRFCCSTCNTSLTEIRHGRELDVVSLELDS